jgi:hypothetical protein
VIPVAELGQELLLIAQALGLADGSGTLDPTFFEHPLRNLESLLSNPTQRDAVL